MVYQVTFSNGYPACEIVEEIEADTVGEVAMWAEDQLETYANDYEYLLEDDLPEGYTDEEYEMARESYYSGIDYTIEEAEA